MGLELLRLLPSFFAVAFVGPLTVLLSLSSLALTYRNDFQLEPALRLHGRMTLCTAALGGYLCVISIGRSQASDETYFVESGRPEVVKMGLHRMPVRLAKIVTGSMIGEMALYSGRPRTASVIAVEPARLRVLTHDGWNRLQAQRPDLARRFDHHVILNLASMVGRTSAALSQQEG